MEEDDDNVTSMSEGINDARYWTPEQVLIDAKRRLGSGEIKCTKLLVVHLNDAGDEQYDVGYMQAQMSASEIIALCEVIKQMALEELDS